MALDDEMKNAKFSPDSQLRDEAREELSAEDVAWVDSCLVKESEISDSGWDSMKEALLEVMSTQLGLNNSAPESRNENIAIDNDDAMVTVSDHVEPESDRCFLNKEDGEDIPINLFNIIPFSKESDRLGDSFMAEDVEDSKPTGFSGDPFLPSYTKESEETRMDESNGGPSFLAEEETEPSRNEIFMVWDLNLSPGENEHASQLKCMLEQDVLEPKMSLDNVIDGISKMSVTQSSVGN